jgi:hypothetical protein
MAEPNKGIIYMNKLMRSTAHTLPELDETEFEEMTE